jgi:hypothetical protein
MSFFSSAPFLNKRIVFWFYRREYVNEIQKGKKKEEIITFRYSDDAAYGCLVYNAHNSNDQVYQAVLIPYIRNVAILRIYHIGPSVQGYLYYTMSLSISKIFMIIHYESLHICNVLFLHYLNSVHPKWIVSVFYVGSSVFFCRSHRVYHLSCAQLEICMNYKISFFTFSVNP